MRGVSPHNTYRPTPCEQCPPVPSVHPSAARPSGRPPCAATTTAATPHRCGLCCSGLPCLACRSSVWPMARARRYVSVPSCPVRSSGGAGCRCVSQDKVQWPQHPPLGNPWGTRGLYQTSLCCAAEQSEVSAYTDQ